MSKGFIMILNKAQAQAVYSAMVALNNVYGYARIELEKGIVVEEAKSGRVEVTRPFAGGKQIEVEGYHTQMAFAFAYGLD